MTEGRRIAEELHDGAMQEVTLARLQVDLLCASVSDASLADELVRLSDLLGQAGEQLQQVMHRLVPRMELA